MSAAAIIFSVLAGYLLGSLDFGIIFTRAFTHTDIREYGSGNAGMTNVLRSVGPLPGILTGIGDFSKGAAAIVIGHALFAWGGLDTYIGGYLAGMCALVGHLFPLYFGFRGGKGVMTTAGILLIVNPRLLLVVLLAFGLAFALSKIVSLSSLCAALSLPIANVVLCLATQKPWLVSTAFSVVICALIFITHRTNIKRILNGTESKLVIKKAKSTEADNTANEQ